METDTRMLRRRALMSSMLGLGAGLALDPRAFAATQYLELDNPAIPVKDPTHVYMVAGASAGKRILAGGAHGVIIYSDDLGQSWHQASVPVSTTITCIAFVTDKIGWATGGFGVVLNTQDGGQSWVKQLDGIQEIKLMNEATKAYIATLPPDSDIAAHLTRRNDILTQQGPDKPFLSLLPITASDVFAFGTYRFADYSSDGGKNWTDWSTHIGEPAAVSKNLYGAAALYGAYYIVSETGLIYRSTDGGKSFPKLAQLGPATFFGICDAGKGNILAYGVAGQMFLSTDNGNSWNAPTFPGDANINCGSLIPTGEVVAGDNGGGIWVSKDNGRSFTMVTRNPGISVNALIPIGGTRVLLVCNIGILPFDLANAEG